MHSIDLKANIIDLEVSVPEYLDQMEALLDMINSKLGWIKVFPDTPMCSLWWHSYGWMYQVFLDKRLVGYFAVTGMERPKAILHAGTFEPLHPSISQEVMARMENMLHSNGVTELEIYIPDYNRAVAELAARRYGFSITKKEGVYYGIKSTNPPS